ncbi:L-lactate permease [Streptomyces cinereoruber]|uniref:L-lactate permease n=1 Tax=Streptomyces cinereoruber TaxID=67260 RepID=UPI0036291952
MLFLLALLPILLVIAALVLRQSSTRAALAGVGTAAVVGMFWFGFDGGEAWSVLTQWWPIILEVLLIIYGGIAFAEASRRTGAQEVLARWLRENLGTGVVPVLAIVHGVTPLAESLTGFGIGMAIGVPLLYGLGIGGCKAATTGLLGLCIVPWGSMGPGTLIASHLAGVDFDALGAASAAISLAVFLGTGIAAALIVAGPGERLLGVLFATCSAFVLWGGVWGANLLFGTAPAGAVGAALVLVMHMVLRRARGNRITLSAEVRRAGAAHVVLLGGVLSVAITVRALGLADSGWHYLASPALWLAIATLTALRHHGGERRATVGAAARSWIPVGPATGLFVLLGAVMSVSGMSAQIASTLTLLGSGYLALTPVLGGLGGFLAGSNSGANAMFAGPQAVAATTLGAPVLAVTAMQNVSGSILIMASPARVEFATRLCPDAPDKTSILRTVLAINATIVAILALLSVLFIPTS